MTIERLTELLVRREEGLLTDDEEQDLLRALGDDPRLRRMAAEHYALLAGLAGALPPAMDSGIEAPAHPPRARGRVAALVALGVAGTLFALASKLIDRQAHTEAPGPAQDLPGAGTRPRAVPLWSTPTEISATEGRAPPLAARIEEVAGTVHVLRDGRKSPAKDGDLLHDESGAETVGTGSRIAIRLGDGTRLALGGDARIALSATKSRAAALPGHRVLFDRGALDVNRLSSAPGALVVVTPHAAARANPGAVRARLVVSLESTRVQMHQGALSLERFSDGSVSEVGSGQQALVTEDAALAAAAPNSGLAGHWTFDEADGARVADSSPWKNHGLLRGGPARAAAGRIGAALQLDGATVVVQLGDPDNGSLDMGTDDFTMGAWIKTTAAGPILNKRGGASGAGFGLRIVNGAVDFYMRERGDIAATLDDARPTGRAFAAASSGRGYNDGQWHHVMVVVDRDDKVTFYRDGIFDGAKEVRKASGSINTSLTFTIGAVANRDGRLTEVFDGLIDDVRIYRRALTSEEALALARGAQ